MIFVTTGTQLSFDRLFDMVERLCELREIEEEVICQGFSSKQYDFIKIKKHLNEHDYENIFNNSRLIIAHAGMGTFLTAVANSKRLIMVPRRFDLGEHRNNHQCDIADILIKKGVSICQDLEELKIAVRENIKTVDYEDIPSKKFIKNLGDLVKGYFS